MSDWSLHTLLGDAALVIRTFIAPLLAYAAWVLRRMDQRIGDTRHELSEKIEAGTDQVRALNERMVRLEEWRQLHDQTDQTLHLELGRRIGRLEDGR